MAAISDTSLIFNLLAIDRASEKILGVKSAFGLLAVGAAAAAATIAVKSVEMAGDFQAAMTRVQTGAGESAANMAMVSQGVLDMAGKVGKPLHELTAGLYMVNSAGYHGAEGLKVLELSAKGAKVGAAELATVADAVTTALNAYHMGADHTAEAVNALIGAEKQGKTNMEALAGSLSKVAPAAAVAGVSLNEVLAAMSTMTAQGTSADIAATYLRQTILQLSNPTAKAALEMKSLGLNAIDVSQNLGRNGLAATLEMLTNAIQAKMGPAGTVLIQQLQKSANSTSDFEKVLSNLPPVQQTYIGALANMVGGTKSMQAALQLTGGNLAVFKANIAAISDNVKAGGADVEGWSTVQGNFNQKVAEAKGQIEALRVEIGTALMPKMLELLNGTMSAVQWGEKHTSAVKVLTVAIGSLAAAVAVIKIGIMVSELGKAVKAFSELKTVINVAKGAWMLLNIEFMGTPIGLIIGLIALLVIGFIYLWNHSAAFRNFFIGMWQHIWSFLKTVGTWFKDVLWGQYLWPTFQAIGHAAMWLWHNAIKPAIDFIVGYYKMLGAVAMWLWDNAIKPAIDFIVGYFKMLGAAAMWLWSNAIKPAFDFISNIVTSVAKVIIWLDREVFTHAVAGIKAELSILGAIFGWLYRNIISPVVDSVKMQIGILAAVFMWLYDHAVKPTIDAIATAWNWLYANVIVPVVGGFKLELQYLGDAFKWLWHHVIEPVWDGIKIAISFAWEKGIKPVFNAVASAVKTLGGVFKDIFSAIGHWVSSAFESAVGYVKGYINMMIDLVNKVGGFLNRFIDKINSTTGSTFSHFATMPHLASGGDVTRGGLAVVGEHGAEVVRLPTGAAVFPHGTVPAGQSGTQAVELRLVVDLRGATPEMKKLIRKIVRVDGGGDVEVAFT